MHGGGQAAGELIGGSGGLVGAGGHGVVSRVIEGIISLGSGVIAAPGVVSTVTEGSISQFTDVIGPSGDFGGSGGLCAGGSGSSGGGGNPSDPCDPVSGGIAAASRFAILGLILWLTV
ncbi:hypothetical protein QAD02_005818 [Eretmocerus hayati]|uniref:Uncharacterized protein n=1 Tax=Eretmocerus hayati TaxID=131215 RepID=A0ACC2NTR4_9HYME|nr:hypothetical protein QAD02_005818 [Eretmocerus hayati]